MLDAMAPQKHHQQAGSGGTLLLAATSSPSSSITTVSSSPSSISTSPSSSSSAGSHQQQPIKHHHLEQSKLESSQTESHDDTKTSTTNVTPQDSHNHQATNTAINNTSSGLKNLHNNNSPSLHRSKITGRDQSITKTPSVISSPLSSPATSTTPAATSTTTITTTSQSTQNYHHSTNQHNNSNTSSGNVYQSPRYSHQSNSANHSHPIHTTYQTRTNNHQQRGHNNNSNHGNQKNSHQHHQHSNHHHHNHHQHHNNHNQTYVGSANDHHNHKHHHHLQQQQHPQQPQQHNLPMPFTSSSSSTSLPGSDIASSNSSVTNQRGSSCGPPHYVDLHVNAGECVSLQMLDGQEQFLTGPATITMISQQQNPPVPIPVQVPPGHMVHQIADENGTLRHIILSVMDIDDNTPLNSSVIDLPHGSFRINSHGELVSADATTNNLGAVASGQTVGGQSNNDDNNDSSSRHQEEVAQTATSQHLPQQQTTTYYANYDGCPVAHYDATQNNNNNSSNNINSNSNINNNNNINNQLSESNIEAQENQEEQHQQEKKVSDDTSTTNSRPTDNEMGDKSTSRVALPLESPDVIDDKHKQDKHESAKISEPLLTNSEQITVATTTTEPASAVPASVYHQQHVLGAPELNSSLMAPPAPASAPHPGPVQGQLMSTVDDQTLYGYPACSCCCCYCDPTQDPNAAAAAAAHQHHQDNPDVLMPHQSEMIMTSELSATPPTISSNVAAGGDPAEADLSTCSNGVLPYARSTHHHHHHNQQHHHANSVLGPIQSSDPAVAMPLNMATGSLISSQALHPLTGQNGLVPMHAPNVHYAEVTSSPPTKHHKGSRGGPGGGMNGNYKQQTKAAQGQTSAGDRHQSNYVGHHNHPHHYNTNQSYNNMVAGSTYYLQDSIPSPASYKAAGQGLLSHPNVMVGSPAPATQTSYPNYSNYSQQPVPASNVVVSSSTSSSGKQSTNNNLAYNRAGELDNHHLQRPLNNGRLDNHTGAANRHPLVASNAGYGFRNNQHVDNINKRQQHPLQSASIGTDKMPRFGANTAASVVAGNSRVLANNHVMLNASSVTQSNNNLHYQVHHHHHHHHHQQQQQHNQHHHQHQTNSGNNSNSSSIGGSVSPFRPTSKGKSSYHHNNHLQQQSLSVPPNAARSNVGQPSAYHAAHNAPKIVNLKQDECMTARPNQSVTKTHLTTKNLAGQFVDLNQPHQHQQQQRLMTTKHIRSRDRNSASPSSNSSYQNQHLSQSPHRPKQHKQQQPSIATSHSANNVASLPTPPIVTDHYQGGPNKHRANIDTLDSSDRHSAAAKPVKEQVVGVVDEPASGAPRTSRGKQKKCHKENTKPPNDQISQTNQQKRQHSNEETRTNSKNRRARSSNEQSQTNNLRNSTDTIAEIENHKERVNNVQQKRSSRQDGASKANQSSKLAKIDAPREPTTTVKPIEDRQISQGAPSQLNDDSPTIVGNTNPIEDDESHHDKPSKSVDDQSSGELHKHKAEHCGDDMASSSAQDTSRQQILGKIKDNQPSATTSVSESSSSQSPKGESPARKKSKSSPSSSKQSSPKSGPVDANNSGVNGKNNKRQADEITSSSSNDKNNDDVFVVASLDDGEADISTTPPQHKQTIAISLRTSLSENNIQSLNIASLNTAKSTQTTPQKQQQQQQQQQQLLLQPQQPTKDQVDANQAEPIAMKKVDTTTTNIAKRKSSNGKTEQQFKLNSLPQIRLLNLNCVSVTSNSVSLRWSYVAALADKHGINHHHQHHHHHHNHHHGASKHSFCYDHYVVECSSGKNVETNTLVSPKIVYQGCAMACRINSLTPEKIYHFRIRRTVLVPSNDGDNLAVSEILSVTLPSIQQQQQQQQTKELTSSNSGVNHKKSHQMADSNATTTTSSSLVSSSSSSSLQSTIASTARGNTSSQINAQQGNISNNKSSSSHHHHHHNHNNNNNHHPIKMSNILRQCRNRIVSSVGTVVRNSFSNYSDTKFALLLLVVFTIFAMLLAIFIHLYILSPVNE